MWVFLKSLSSLILLMFASKPECWSLVMNLVIKLVKGGNEGDDEGSDEGSDKGGDKGGNKGEGFCFQTDDQKFVILESLLQLNIIICGKLHYFLT